MAKGKAKPANGAANAAALKNRTGHKRAWLEQSQLKQSTWALAAPSLEQPYLPPILQKSDGPKCGHRWNNPVLTLALNGKLPQCV
jgi:hypothetical protein